MSTKQKSKTTSNTTNSLPSWLTTPYQNATQAATNLYSTEPAISSTTQNALNNVGRTAAFGNAIIPGAVGTLASLAGGNFGTAGASLGNTASGAYLSQNPFASSGMPQATSSALNGFASNGGGAQTSSALNGYIQGGQPSAVSGALSAFLGNGNPQQVSSALQALLANGNPQQVSSALDGFAQNGGGGNIAPGLAAFLQPGHGAYDTTAASGYLQDSGLNKTASGYYLTPDSNPYIKSIATAAGDDAQARINAQFGAAGRSNGSGLYAQNFAKGIDDASNSVYAQNYANERQLQQGAQNTLLGANQTVSENAASRYQAEQEAALAREYGAAGVQDQDAQSALARQLSAAGSIFGAQNQFTSDAAARQYGAAQSQFGAENQAGADALGRQYGASGALFGAQNAANEAAAGRQYGATTNAYNSQNDALQAALGRQYGAAGQQYAAQNAAGENAANRQATAYNQERDRQQSASTSLLGTQLQASQQIPGLLAALLSGNTAGVAAGQYGDQAQGNQLGQYAGLLSLLANPFGIQNSTGTQKGKTYGLGPAINSFATLSNAFANAAKAAG